MFVSMDTLVLMVFAKGRIAPSLAKAGFAVRLTLVCMALHVLTEDALCLS